MCVNNKPDFFQNTMATKEEETLIRTFTNWCNRHLEATHHKIKDLRTDFCDGVRLVALVEVLSKKQVHGKLIKSENEIYWHDNVAVALQFLKDSENLLLVNIGKVFYNLRLTMVVGVFAILQRMIPCRLKTNKNVS